MVHISRSMKTCANIATAVWPIIPVAKAIRHGWYAPGRAFVVVLSQAANGHPVEANTNQPTVSR